MPCFSWILLRLTGDLIFDFWSPLEGVACTAQASEMLTSLDHNRSALGRNRCAALMATVRYKMIQESSIGSWSVLALAKP